MYTFGPSLGIFAPQQPPSALMMHQAASTQQLPSAAAAAAAQQLPGIFGGGAMFISAQLPCQDASPHNPAAAATAAAASPATTAAAAAASLPASNCTMAFSYSVPPQSAHAHAHVQAQAHVPSQLQLIAQQLQPLRFSAPPQQASAACAAAAAAAAAAKRCEQAPMDTAAAAAAGARWYGGGPSPSAAASFATEIESIFGGDPELCRWVTAVPSEGEVTAFRQWAARLRPGAVCDAPPPGAPPGSWMSVGDAARVLRELQGYPVRWAPVLGVVG